MTGKIIRRLFCLLLVLAAAETLRAQGTAFLYQGRLNDGGSPASGNYDLAFTLYDSTNVPGTALSATLTNTAVPVSGGLFTVKLDFGPGLFTGTNFWLQIAVRTNGNLTFTNLSPRQPVLPVPYAVFANSTSNLLGVLPAAQLGGTLPATAFTGYTNTVALTNNANLFAGTFSGNGGAVTNVKMTNLTGVLTDVQLPANTAFVNSNQTFSGSNNFTGPVNFYGTNFFVGPNAFTNFGNSFIGSFFGNGLVGWIATNGTAVQAQIDHGYLLTNAQLATVTLPAAPSPGDIVRISGAGAGGWQIAQNAGQSVLGNFSSFASSSWMPTSVASPLNWDSLASSADGSTLLASAFNGGIYISKNSGNTWTQTNSVLGPWRSVACSADGSKLVAALYGGGIFTNSATVWGVGGSTASLNWISVASSADGTRLVAAVNLGGIYTSTNYGVTWIQRTVGLPINPNWWYVASSASGSNLVALVQGGGVYTSADAGNSWGQQTTGLPNNPTWEAVASSVDGSRLAAVALGSGIYTSANSGSSWTLQTNGAPANFNWASVASSADGSKLAAAVHGGGIYFSSNSGLSWTPVNPSSNSNNWYAITASADGSKLVAGVYGGGIYIAQSSLQSTTTVGTNGYIGGVQGSAVELQYIGGGRFMPVSSAGAIWAY